MPRAQLSYNPEYYGRHFDARRTKDAHGDIGVLRENFVNLTMPAGSTDFDSLSELGRSSYRPFPIKSLSEKLKEQEYIRGCIYSGELGDQIERILLSYPYLRWWIEREGLVVDEARTELDPIPPFDRFAGPLVLEHMKDGKLSASALESIAVRLDAEGFLLRENLQPAQWKPISKFNQTYSKLAIKTFIEAVNRPQFVHGVRRRLYFARDRYKKALRPAEPIFVTI